MTGEMREFRAVSPAPRDVWESLTKANNNVVVSQSLAWHNAVVGSGRYKDASLLYDFPSGHQVVLPMVKHRWRPPWEPAAASWPRAWGAGGPITGEGGIDRSEAAAVLGDVARRDIIGTEIHLSHAADPVWRAEARQFRVSQEPCYILDLAGGFDQIWSDRFRGSARRAVRKAQRSDLQVDTDRTGRLFGEFYELYEKSIHRWAAAMREPVWITRRLVTRSTPMGMLDLIAKEFGDSCTTWMARHEGHAVAAIIVLQAGQYAQYWLGAMDKPLATPVRANELLHSLAIEDAHQNGCRFYDMGYAGPGSPLAGFKEKLGATLQFSHYLLAERVPILSGARNSLRLLREMSRQGRAVIPRRSA